jgi:hypothetical protein
VTLLHALGIAMIIAFFVDRPWRFRLFVALLLIVSFI